MRQFRNAILILIIIGAGVLGSALLFRRFHDSSVADTTQVTIGTTTIAVSIADTEIAREQGLSGVASLGEYQGKLFVFDAPGQYGFWMKDMHFPLDILWIAEDGMVVDITHDATPESYPDVFVPEHQVKYVLEVNAGFSTAHRLHIGDIAKILE